MTATATAADVAADLTDQHLRLAFRQMRRPASWPPIYEAVMEDHARAACVRGYARSVTRTLGRRLAFDARKAAANDFDD